MTQAPILRGILLSFLRLLARAGAAGGWFWRQQVSRRGRWPGRAGRSGGIADM